MDDNTFFKLIKLIDDTGFKYSFKYAGSELSFILWTYEGEYEFERFHSYTTKEIQQMKNVFTELYKKVDEMIKEINCEIEETNA